MLRRGVLRGRCLRRGGGVKSQRRGWGTGRGGRGGRCVRGVMEVEVGRTD